MMLTLRIIIRWPLDQLVFQLWRWETRTPEDES